MTSCRTTSYGLFEGASDVGTNVDGQARFVPSGETYIITSGGENIWGARDGFHMLWKKVNGDLSLQTDVSFPESGTDPHRKAGWMIRAGLKDDDPYADAIVHGDGLIAFQYRAARGGETREVLTPIKAPARVRLERTGNVFSMYVAKPNGAFQPVGAISLDLPETAYAGLVLSAHNPTARERAVFSDVRLEEHGTVADDQRVVESTLEIIDVTTGERRIVHQARDHFEAPNWSRDGKTLLFNSHGSLYTIPVSGGTPVKLNTGTAARLNNDHGYSPDGTMLAISHSPENRSLIYTLSAAGGEPRLITTNGPSYWHGWSPDGRLLAYCAERNGNYDIYTIPVEGGDETRLTTAEGLDDGPDYSPDGRYIYFNSVRSGQMKIWRMNADGSDQVQLTPTDDYGDWFAHPSYDGKQLVFVSYDKSVEGHPANKNVVLRAMPAEGGTPRILAVLFGGQGTINVPSWSPDDREVAFVSYRLVAL